MLAAEQGCAMDDAPRRVGRSAGYFSYLLRLWRDGGEEGCWRASLHDPHTGERVGFGDIDELFAYLQERTRATGGIGGVHEGAERGGAGAGR
jgi:hypothetical protein